MFPHQRVLMTYNKVTNKLTRAGSCFFDFFRWSCLFEHKWLTFSNNYQTKGGLLIFTDTVLAVVMAFPQLSRSLTGLLVDASSIIHQRFFSVSTAAAAIQKMTRVRVVDNSSLGNTPYHRSPRVIHVYTKNGVGKVGDRVLLAIKGQKKKALIVGHKMPGERMSPRFDSNNVVLIEDNGNPTGTRIKVPMPTHLRKLDGDYSKLLAIASSFV
ncbi:39S ribosomal protein L14, mitochondrial isoform X1 [Xiphias gladius]|uniref:39S ribosomal protein L14, mitochondrial isoform X1 n=2 Tax=Xiphias gladius TaxID=8245 RepID=UPI001A97D9F8|nr:39S ribosomal protein L14, mitochondrial isoform X1 [Xiphias gladius]